MIRTLAILIGVLPPVVLVMALVFRATLYWTIPVADGEPKGGGEILEVLLFLGLLTTSALAVLVAILLAVVPAIREARLAVRLGLVALFSPVAYWVLHPLVPRLVW